MRLTLSDVVLAASLLVAAAVGVHWLSTRTVRPIVRAGSIVVDSMKPDYSPCESAPADAVGVGRVEFQPPDGVRLVGVAGAKLYPIEGCRVVVERWDDVTSANVDGGLDLRTWLDRRSPSGPHALLFGLWLDGRSGREYRVGWAKFEASELRFARIVVHPDPARACRLSVATSLGQSVPGAYVALAPRVHMNGYVTIGLTTAQDGTCTVSGLRDLTWIASLPFGVGPDATDVKTQIDPQTAEARVVSPIRGRWTFVEAEIELPYRGASLQAEKLTDAAGGAARAWPVSTAVPAGTGLRRRWTWMVPESADPVRARGVDVTFHGFRPVRIDDVTRAFLVHATPTEFRVEQPANGK